MFEGLEIKVPLYIGATLPLSPVQNKLYFLRLLVGSKKTWQHPGLNLFNSPHPSPASPWNLCSDKALSFLGITYIFFFFYLHAGLALFKITSSSEHHQLWCSESVVWGELWGPFLLCWYHWPCSSLHSFIEIILCAYNMPCTVPWVGETEIKVYEPWILSCFKASGREVHIIQPVYATDSGVKW